MTPRGGGVELRGASRAVTTFQFGAHQNSNALDPTAEVVAEWQRARDRFNAGLFDGTLPDFFLTFTQAPQVMGHFSAHAIRNDRGVEAHEIAINLNWVAGLGVVEGWSTLVHEMCHLWRHLYGGPNRKGGASAPGYHDAIWADRMEAVGLMPSSTGRPGGKRTGYRMAEYVIEGGPFDLISRELLIADETIRWVGTSPPLFTFSDPNSSQADPAGRADPAGTAESGRRARKRTRFVCPNCELKAWARPSAKLACVTCGLTLNPT
jgi:hypothetical protein